MQRFTLQSPLEKISDSAWQPRRASILLVEDNPADVTLVREALEEHGVEGELLVVRDGETALGLIQEIESEALKCPDLFIVDLNIPKKPGREVIEHMRQSATFDQALIAVLSSSASARDQEDARRLRVTRYIRKPSRLDEFLSLGAVFKAMLGPAK